MLCEHSNYFSNLDLVFCANLATVATFSNLLFFLVDNSWELWNCIQEEPGRDYGVSGKGMEKAAMGGSAYLINNKSAKVEGRHFNSFRDSALINSL